MAKITWMTRYVSEGVLEPDKHGRWMVIGYIEVPGSQFENFDIFETMTIPICHIVQKGTSNGVVPSLVDRFSCKMTIVDDQNIGFGEKYLFSNDLDDLKDQIEKSFNKTIEVFKSAL